MKNMKNTNQKGFNHGNNENDNKSCTRCNETQERYIVNVHRAILHSNKDQKHEDRGCTILGIEIWMLSSVLVHQEVSDDCDNTSHSTSHSKEE